MSFSLPKTHCRFASCHVQCEQPASPIAASFHARSLSTPMSTVYVASQILAPYPRKPELKLDELSWGLRWEQDEAAPADIEQEAYEDLLDIFRGNAQSPLLCSDYSESESEDEAVSVASDDTWLMEALEVERCGNPMPGNWALSGEKSAVSKKRRSVSVSVGVGGDLAALFSTPEMV